MELVILSQPEEQHRARYLTEGSRGAIKDVTGMGHPIVKLNGYYSRQPIKLECYIGHDKHNGLPHLFYQASKISGKNSTQCTACKVEGTSVIVMNLLPEHGMQATIDCVGILKERNVDVEQKLLNLNHSSKMLDFDNHHHNHTTSHQAPYQQQSAFTSITAQQSNNQQQQQQQLNQTIQTQLQPQQLQQHLQQQQQQQQQLHEQNNLHLNNNHLLSSNNHNHLLHNHLNHHHHQLHESNGIIKFGRRGDAMDENSISSMSRADSIEDSQDVSRHSLMSISTTATTQSVPIVSPISKGLALINGTATTLSDQQQQQQSNGTANGVLAQNGAPAANLVTLNCRKRSVRCRLVFRVKIPETGEVLQTISTPIICTQPLGTPEICKKSVTKAPANGASNLELFIIGKNFLKDSKIVFRNKKSDWIKVVEPDKEFLNSSHLVCKVPDYDGPDLTSNVDMIEVEFQVRSGDKFSEPHMFVYVNNNNNNNIINNNNNIISSNNNSNSSSCSSGSSSNGGSRPESVISSIQNVHAKVEYDTNQQQQLTSAQQVHQIHEQQLTNNQQQVQLIDQQQHQQIHQQQQYQPESQQQQQQQFDQQQQQHVIQEQQIQQQLVLQQQSQPQQQQQQISTAQILTTIDLNDETTVVYADNSLQNQPTLVHSVIQNGAILNNMNQIEPLDQMNAHQTVNQIQVIKQQQIHQQQSTITTTTTWKI